jgi:hypothetical protein
MKKKHLNIWLVSCLAIFLAFALTLWPSFRTAAQKTDKPASTNSSSKSGNTNPKSATKHSGNKVSEVDQQSIDKAMQEVQKAMEKIQKEDWPKVQAEISRAMKEIDAEKISREVQLALKEVDMEKINLEVQKAMKEIDMAKISQEVKLAMKEIDFAGLQKELAVEMKKLHEELKDVHINVEKEMQKAKVELKKAHAQLELMREGMQMLEADGLIKKGEKVDIEYKDNILYLNGKPQSKEVSEKYKKYFSNSGTIRTNMIDDEEESKLVK